MNKEEWAAYVLSYDAKTGSIRSYCREKEIPYEGFRYWYKKLVSGIVSSDHAKVGKSRFVPVHLKDQSLKPADQGRLCLKFNDITVVVYGDKFCPDLLRQTLSVIRSC